MADTPQTIEAWRDHIDSLDRQLVSLLSQRARAAQAIGALKRTSDLPIYEPNREKTILENVRANNPGPLPGTELQHIYERIIDVMRALQRDQATTEKSAQAEVKS
jgi:chorismate mutase-like protein